MADQVPLFPGNRGCGKREMGAAITDMDIVRRRSDEGYQGRLVIVRINGVKLESPNRSATVSRGARMAQAGRTKKLRETVRVHILGALGVGHAPPSSVVVTRLSFGELDRDNAWSSCKPVFDGIADAFGLPNDRELQKSGDVRQSKCARGTSGVIVELYFAKLEGA